MTKRLDALREFMSEASGVNSYWDLVTEIIVAEMTDIIKYQLDPKNDIYETIKNKRRLFRGAARILKYYSTVNEYEAFKKDNPSDWYRE